ncbi:hypothetical protein TGCAST_207420 [Toxoplasma gondii CAST]|uniref:Uncharacterized protein n=2 Tax=Toxoplasma gondii TaxID=5811 RepID=A0A2G8XTV9_TOXGO|nr:hypothetical protein TGCOUG_207420 [Toxoplasma gondii COUG]RQX69282.1 hypothetical protein TGCAST_207420 [Toxoplasma gondii CAST]
MLFSGTNSGTYVYVRLSRRENNVSLSSTHFLYVYAFSDEKFLESSRNGAPPLPHSGCMYTSFSGPADSRIFRAGWLKPVLQRELGVELAFFKGIKQYSLFHVVEADPGRECAQCAALLRLSGLSRVSNFFAFFHIDFWSRLLTSDERKRRGRAAQRLPRNSTALLPGNAVL